MLKLNVGEGAEKLDLSDIADGDVNGKAALDNDLVVSYNCTTQPSQTGSYFREMNKNLCMNIHGNFTHNSKKLEITQMSYNGRMVKQTYTMEY